MHPLEDMKEAGPCLLHGGCRQICHSRKRLLFQHLRNNGAQRRPRCTHDIGSLRGIIPSAFLGDDRGSTRPPSHPRKCAMRENLGMRPSLAKTPDKPLDSSAHHATIWHTIAVARIIHAWGDTIACENMVASERLLFVISSLSRELWTPAAAKHRVVDARDISASSLSESLPLDEASTHSKASSLRNM